jgi:hypothetical protein
VTERARTRAEAARPRAETALALLCAATVVFLAARDLFVPEIRDVEVWLGFELRGRAAELTAPFHWAIFAIGAWAFWRAAPWVWSAAAAYVFYVAVSHLVWSEASPNGRGWPMGLLQAAGFSLLGVWLLRRRRTQRAAAAGS